MKSSTRKQLAAKLAKLEQSQSEYPTAGTARQIKLIRQQLNG
jgi:hypothetical protein